MEIFVLKVSLKQDSKRFTNALQNSKRRFQSLSMTSELGKRLEGAVFQLCRNHVPIAA